MIDDDNPAAASDHIVPPLTALLLGVYVLAVFALLFFLIFWVWPNSPEIPGPWGMKQEARLFLCAGIFGAIGSHIHLATSFVDDIGNRRLASSWIWWFILRTPVGMALAIVFYVALRGGFLAETTAATDQAPISPYGVAALSAMVGLFSQQATEKLNELFATLFQTKASKPEAAAAAPVLAAGGDDAKRGEASVAAKVPPAVDTAPAA